MRHLLLNFFSLSCLLMTVYSSNAQTCGPCTDGEEPSNNNCFTAQNLGILPDPGDCGFASGTLVGETVTVVGTNVCGSPSDNKPIPQFCSGVGEVSTEVADVWYTFEATGTNLVMDVEALGTALSKPYIALWEQQRLCSGMVLRNCVVGNNQKVELEEPLISPGFTYYVQVSGIDIDQTCSFLLNIRNNKDCAECILSSELTSVEPEPKNGTFSCGEKVEFCYTITEFNQAALNWLHGIAPKFGNGWDLETLAPINPNPNSCDGSGNWLWAKSVTGTNIGLTAGPGWFYDSSQGGPQDGNPGNNYGDANEPSCQWTFCWEITTKPCTVAVEGMDLSMEIENYGDSETGSWTDYACEGDPNYVFNAIMDPCIPPVLAITEDTLVCEEGINLFLTASILAGEEPINLAWFANGVYQGVGNTLQVAPTETTTYVVKAQNECGITEEQVTITVGDEFICDGIVRLYGKLWLEGPYRDSTKLMSTTLNEANLIPKKQPFNTAPWLYDGEEKQIGHFHNSIVDWVLLEVRTSANAESVITRKAALLTKEGFLMDVADTIGGVKLTELALEENYYISVKTRNHLAILLNNPLPLSSMEAADSSTYIDFVNPNHVVGGLEQVATIAENVYALRAGDINGDGTITILDFNLYLEDIAKLNVYSKADCNFDKGVTITDLNLYVPNSSIIGVKQIRYD